MTLTASPQWPMPPAADQDDATLIAECARVLRNGMTPYSAGLASELTARFPPPVATPPADVIG